MPPSPSRPVRLWDGNARKTGGLAKRRPALASREPDSAVALAFLFLMTPTFLFICNRSMCTAFYSAIFIKHHFFVLFLLPRIVFLIIIVVTTLLGIPWPGFRAPSPASAPRVPTAGGRSSPLADHVRMCQPLTSTHSLVPLALLPPGHVGHL